MKIKTIWLWLIMLIVRAPLMVLSLAFSAIGHVLEWWADLIPTPSLPKLLEFTPKCDEKTNDETMA